MGHPFIFDYRLIPEYFEGLEVKAHMMEEMPKEFPEEYWMEPNLDEYYSIDRFKNFVDRDFDRIKIALKASNLTKREALNALTRDFEKHKEWIERIKQERELEHKGHVAFFNQLLKEINTAFLISEIYKKRGNYDWGYSVTSTSFQKTVKVIVGFNWGVDKEWLAQGNSYGAQKDYPYRSFISNYNDLGSLKRTIQYFNKYCDTLPQIQTNFCFFRSEEESQICSYDLELCSELFKKLLEYLEPEMLISFSKRLNQYLLESGNLESEHKIILSGNRQFQATKGTIKIAERSVQYFNLPHPNYPIRRESRDEAWKYCFGDPKY